MSQQSPQATFISESRDLLAEMEAALLRLEGAPDDAEAINAVFRAAHTIKGSAGVFGFDGIVDFTHAAEAVLEALRAGDIVVDAELIGLLLSTADHLAVLIDTVDSGAAVSDELARSGDTLRAQLDAYIGPPALSAGLPAEAEPAVDREQSRQVTSDAWHVSLRFGPDTLRHGLEPLSFLAYLATMGEIVAVESVFDALPAADEMDAESCYLGLEIDFRCNVDKQTLEGVFDFLRDDCAIRILPPHSLLADYVDLIEQLPEDKERLGELLVRSGALTANELEEGLRLQAKLDGPVPAAEHMRKLGEILIDEHVVPTELVNAALDKQKAIKERRSLESNVVRVRADKLDELITLVGELVIAGAGTRLIAKRTGHSELIESTSTVERLVEEVRERALKLRMVPIAETFARFKRVVRDLGRELGKDVELVLTGVETEVDKSMAERIIDPLTHLVRNAMDHGIEPPDQRVARHKSRSGRLQMNAYHESGSIVIEVADDGAGLDRERIVAKAVRQGLIAGDDTLTDEEVWNLIMQPGFSTAEQVTSVSGRGIGMDVVRRNVEALRGTVSISSAAGRGTTTSLRLPLTLAIIEGFCVAVGKSVYVIPLDMVIECIEMPAVDTTDGYTNLRGEVLPLLRLRDVFEVNAKRGKRENVVVVQYGAQRAGFVVDNLLGEYQTVIKPLGKLFERLSGISGSTILGTGDVALILDVPELVQRAIGRDRQHQGYGGPRALLQSK